MTGDVLRRSALALGLLGVLLTGAGALLSWWGAPVWVPFLLAVLVVTAQWALGPHLVQWLVPAPRAPAR